MKCLIVTIVFKSCFFFFFASGTDFRSAGIASDQKTMAFVPPHVGPSPGMAPQHALPPGVAVQLTPAQLRDKGM